MKLNTIIRLPDGREGTICYHFLDGYGGKWGRHEFTMPDAAGFGDELPEPDFMLRDPYPTCEPNREYVGGEFDVIEEPKP